MQYKGEEMQKVILSIKGSNRFGEEQDDIEMLTEAKLFKEGDQFTLEYEDEGTPATVTTLVVEKDHIIMRKNGEIHTQFIFEEAKLFEGVYCTPFGNLNVSVLPTLVYSEMNEQEGWVDLEYILNIAGNQVVNRLNLRYRNN